MEMFFFFQLIPSFCNFWYYKEASCLNNIIIHLWKTVYQTRLLVSTSSSTSVLMTKAKTFLHLKKSTTHHCFWSAILYFKRKFHPGTSLLICILQTIPLRKSLNLLQTSHKREPINVNNFNNNYPVFKKCFLIFEGFFSYHC